ncbi:ABC transporter ATP-binding protein [Vibrio salinus]|uniref:ABC transporter ATP-binding protein n=1 Tax=Vibrio salinus TaxID=2899784 RepID=UPI001E4B434D|nr:ABC transporter ATP-binding protein [Vibrio salinus]MCE0493722.1 ABC transporter ATP-binding protein [Vibrio salinus]
MNDDGTPVIRTENLTRTFGRQTAVNQLDLNIPKGIIYGFLGPNGCGKSTTIRLLTGLLRPTTGDIHIFGKPLKGNEEQLKTRLGYMTQKFSLYENLTVEENLNFVGSIYGLKGSRKRQRISELLNLYELKGRESQLSGSMSGGQKQRLALACATLHSPDLLFLDEPTSAVDPENRREFWERLFDLCDSGTTILVSTHYMDEAERCHRIGILDNGVKRADGSPSELMSNLKSSIIEIEGHGLRALKQSLLPLPDVISASQIGSRLRVLIRESHPDPIALLRPFSANHSLNYVRPSLEDVFVSSTGGRHVG